jgi:hypothetical protein
MAYKQRSALTSRLGFAVMNEKTHFCSGSTSEMAAAIASLNTCRT